jgi:DNA replication and repair protein RecF
MFLKNVTLLNYKNYSNLKVEFTHSCNIIYGENAQGKTNLIESIYYLSTLSLFRNIRSDEIIKHGEKNCSISGSVINASGVEKEYCIEIEGKSKIQKINKKKIHNIKDYFGDFFCVAYIPSNINLIEGSPGVRRKNFDRSIFYHNLSFLDIVRDYNKVVSERNYILKTGRNLNSLDLYTELLIEKGTEYIYKRISFLDKFNLKMNEVYKKLLFLEFEKPGIKYKFSNLIINEVLERDEIKKRLEDKYMEVKANEKIKRMTLFGPHLDDFEFLLSQVWVLKKIASQGQKKSFLLAMKLTELELLNEKNPIFFIDDFTSELDERRRELLLKYLNLNNNQSFITTTNINYLPPQNIIKYDKYYVANNTLIC